MLVMLTRRRTFHKGHIQSHREAHVAMALSLARRLGTSPRGPREDGPLDGARLTEMAHRKLAISVCADRVAGAGKASGRLQLR